MIRKILVLSVIAIGTFAQTDIGDTLSGADTPEMTKIDKWLVDEKLLANDDDFPEFLAESDVAFDEDYFPANDNESSENEALGDYFPQDDIVPQDEGNFAENATEFSGADTFEDVPETELVSANNKAPISKKFAEKQEPKLSLDDSIEMED